MRLVSESPARRFGLWPRKGNLMPGADADLLVLDPAARVGDRPGALVTAGGLEPVRGPAPVEGRVIAAFSRGVQVWDGERVLAPARATADSCRGRRGRRVHEPDA